MKSQEYNRFLTHDRTIEEAYADLAGAVIGQAIKDYRLALKAYIRGDEKRKSELSTLEKFFRSEWFVWLIDGKITGEYCIAEVQKQCRTSRHF